MSPTANPSPEAIWRQVESLERSPIFAGSERLLAFLRFIVAETLQGDGRSLKEAVIGNSLYGREPPYDPRIDSTVRVEARRLRRKLKEYYAGPGADDPVRILLAPRGYRPIVTHAGGGVVPGEAIFRDGKGAAVAVLPLRALSSDPGDQSFADGLTDELIYVFGTMHGLRVAARSEVFQYRDRAFSLPEVAQRLAVDAVLQGTVRRYGSRIRITVEASDPDGFVVWSDRFDAPDTDLLGLQERIATTILSRIRFDSSKMRARQIGPGPVALGAHARIYRARQMLDRQTPTALAAALADFREVAASAPDYARGYSGIADCYCDLFRLGLVARPVALAEATAACAEALRIDPQSVEALAARAVIAAWLTWDRATAGEAFRQAATLGENARAARLYASFLTYQGDHVAAERYLRLARTLEPFSLQQDIAESICHYQARRFEALPDAVPTTPETPLESLVFTALGRFFGGDRTAIPAALAGLGDVADYPDFQAIEAELRAWAGDPGPAHMRLGRPLGGSSHFARACLAASVKDTSAVLAALEAAVRQRELAVVWIGTDARFDAFRSLGPFQALLTEIRTPLSADGDKA